jgi:hypothetical protein
VYSRNKRNTKNISCIRILPELLCKTYREAEIIYRASDTILTIDSDAAYQVAAKSRNRASGYHYLGNLDGKLFNGAIFILAKIIKAVMQSAAEKQNAVDYI